MGHGTSKLKKWGTESGCTSGHAKSSCPPTVKDGSQGQGRAWGWGGLDMSYAQTQRKGLKVTCCLAKVKDDPAGDCSRRKEKPKEEMGRSASVHGPVVTRRCNQKGIGEGEDRHTETHTETESERAVASWSSMWSLNGNDQKTKDWLILL